jgi:supervillin
LIFVGSKRTAQENGGLSTTGDKRPSWTIFGKVSQNMETVLFKEKFTDWPDAGRLIKVKEPTGKPKHSVSP